MEVSDINNVNTGDTGQNVDKTHNVICEIILGRVGTSKMTTYY